MKKYFVLELSREKIDMPSMYWYGFPREWQTDLNIGEVSLFNNVDDAFKIRSRLYKENYVTDSVNYDVLVRELNIGIGNIVLQKFFLVHDQDTNKFFVAPNVWVCSKEKAKKFPGTMTVAEITREFIGGEYGPNVVITECKE
jgi:hypothetical protein